MNAKNEHSNDLENFLRNTWKHFNEDRSRLLQYLLLILVCAGTFFLVRFYMQRNNSGLQRDMDNAYYIATNQSLLAPNVAPNPIPLEELSKAVAKGEEGVVLKILAAEAHLKAGIVAVEEKRGLNPESQAGETEAPSIPTDPNKSFEAAATILKELTAGSIKNIKNPDIMPRAWYASGILMEQLAAIEADSDAQLDKAVACYEAVVNHFPNSPFVAPARGRIESLAKPATRDYYKDLVIKYDEALKNPPVSQEAGSLVPAESISTPPSPTEENTFDKIDEFSLGE